MRVLEGPSALVMEAIGDASADVIYIDADHSYEGIRADLAVAIRKIRPDGWIVINDYILVDQLGARTPYGVIYATNAFMVEHRWAMQYFALQTSMYCDVVLRRADLVPTAASRHAALVAEIAALRRDIGIIKASTSWRISAPLRAAGRLVRRAEPAG